MKYVRTAGFLIDLRRLRAEHRKLFVLTVHAPVPGPGRGRAYRCCAMAEGLAHSPDWRELLDDLELCLT